MVSFKIKNRTKNPNIQKEEENITLKAQVCSGEDEE